MACAAEAMKKIKIFKIHFWMYKAPRNSSHLHFLTNGSSKWVKMVIASEDFDGKLFKNVSSSRFPNFLLVRRRTIHPLRVNSASEVKVAIPTTECVCMYQNYGTSHKSLICCYENITQLYSSLTTTNTDDFNQWTLVYANNACKWFSTSDGSCVTTSDNNSERSI